MTYTVGINDVVLLIDNPIHELAKLVTHAMIWGYIGDECPPPIFGIFYSTTAIKPTHISWLCRGGD